MRVAIESAACPKCGHDMKLAEETEWQLNERYSVSFICPNCLHVERIETICLREDENR